MKVESVLYTKISGLLVRTLTSVPFASRFLLPEAFLTDCYNPLSGATTEIEADSANDLQGLDETVGGADMSRFAGRQLEDPSGSHTRVLLTITYQRPFLTA